MRNKTSTDYCPHLGDCWGVFSFYPAGLWVVQRIRGEGAAAEARLYWIDLVETLVARGETTKGCLNMAVAEYNELREYAH